MNSWNEFMVAKLAITLDKFMGLNSTSIILDIAQKHNEYRVSLNEQLIHFDGTCINVESLEKLRKILKETSLVYSYCFDHYTLLPSIILSLGYNVTILLSDELYNKKSEFFFTIKEDLSKLLGRQTKVNFLTNKTPNLLLKLRAAIESETKVIMFVDGNKGSANDKLENTHTTTFKGQNVFFHQGFAFLNYMLKYDSMVGILPTRQSTEIELKFLVDKLDKSLEKKDYIIAATEKLVRNIDTLITIDNIHLWNTLSTVYQWLILSEKEIHESAESRYYPFRLTGEYYAIEYDTFEVYPIKKKDYEQLKKEVSLL